MCQRSCDWGPVACRLLVFNIGVGVCVLVILVNHSAILYSTQQPWFFISEAQGVSDKPDSHI